MGNAIYYCMAAQSTTIQVMRHDGEVLEFDRPVTAKQLMKAYPGHLVVHCEKGAGVRQRSKVSMLRANDTLQLGQMYCLLRVPQRSKVSNVKGKEGDEQNISQQDLQNYYRLPPLPSMQQQQYGGPWRPHLDAIIESPAQTPSRTPSRSVQMSPLARQAGYVPMSPGRLAPTPGKTDPSPQRDAVVKPSPLSGSSPLQST